MPRCSRSLAGAVGGLAELWGPVRASVPALGLGIRNRPAKFWTQAGGVGGAHPGDLAAWLAAIARFRATGIWLGRWRTCAVCGCVLLPGTAGEHFFEH